MEALMQDAQRAIEADDEAALRDAIRRGADVNGMIPCRDAELGESGLCPLLFLAASSGLPGICEILLAEGADADIPATFEGCVSLHTAALQGFTACVRLLLRAGADVNYRSIGGATPLHDACHSGRVDAAEVLIAAGANLEARTNAGSTPLRIAIVNGHREVALTLLRAGAPITALPAAWIKPENTALHDYIIDIIDTGGWNARVERHRRPLMSILSNLALPHDALVVVLSFWSPPGGR
jgi:hypothetical protein